VKFWDASALVPLLVDERTSAAMHALLARDSVAVVWWGSAAECASAIARREREGAIGAAAANAALERLRRLAEGWQEILPSDTVRGLALRLLRVHPLRSADSLQLAAAIVASDGEPSALDFVCLDARLAEAALREGLCLLPR
jgi:predicted nucleic acid-binding protein